MQRFIAGKEKAARSIRGGDVKVCDRLNALATSFPELELGPIKLVQFGHCFTEQTENPTISSCGNVNTD
jgi:hypothetical protein